MHTDPVISPIVRVATYRSLYLSLHAIFTPLPVSTGISSSRFIRFACARRSGSARPGTALHCESAFSPFLFFSHSPSLLHRLLPSSPVFLRPILFCVRLCVLAGSFRHVVGVPGPAVPSSVVRPRSSTSDNYAWLGFGPPSGALPVRSLSVAQIRRLCSSIRALADGSGRLSGPP